MLRFDPLRYLPSAEELPSSDETPVDNELQDLIPHLLKEILAFLWQDREDWYLGVDMGYYYDPDQPAFVPDAFLSVGVTRRKTRPKGRQGRLSYVLWEENYVVPILAMESVSQTYNGEYDNKKQKYAQLGFLYYVIYDSERYFPRKGDAFEVHRLVDGEYVRQEGEPVWMPEIGLGIGRELGTYDGWSREWLYWYDQQGVRYPTRAEQAEVELEQSQTRLTQAEVELEQSQTRLTQTEVELEQQRLQMQALLEQLKARGIDPNELTQED